MRGEAERVSPLFYSYPVQGLKAAGRWRCPKTSSYPDTSLQDGI